MRILEKPSTILFSNTFISLFTPSRRFSTPSRRFSTPSRRFSTPSRRFSTPSNLLSMCVEKIEIASSISSLLVSKAFLISSSI
ncbi:MAG TPA: hypothetical protein DEB09_02085 [Candidatus Magasanikbacteria bacterium]|nr:hypothetical protein [Candidatus Magasanikbacteria bacterium]